MGIPDRGVNGSVRPGDWYASWDRPPARMAYAPAVPAIPSTADAADLHTMGVAVSAAAFATAVPPRISSSWR
jgi:hypothetical protein